MDWRHAEKEGFRTGGIQKRRDIGKKSSGQAGCGTGVYRTAGMQDIWDLGHLGRRTGMMQDFRNAGKVECRNGGMLERMDAGLEGCSIGGMQYRRYAGQDRFRTGGIPDSCNAGK